MPESAPEPVSAEGPAGATPESLLREGGLEAREALGALEEAAVRERLGVAALAGELAQSVRDLQYERKWRGHDALLRFATSLSERAKAVDAGLGALLEQVAACQRLEGKQAELMEALSLLETEVAPYARAVTAADSAFDPITPYGAFVPSLRLFVAEMEAAGKEFGAHPAPEDFVDGSLFRKYQAALGRLAPLLRALAPSPPYETIHGLISAAREKLMQGVALARARADRDAGLLKNVEQVRADLASEFERVETLFAELDASKGGSPEPPSAPPPPQTGPAPAEPRRKGLFGRLRK